MDGIYCKSKSENVTDAQCRECGMRCSHCDDAWDEENDDD